MDLAMAQRLVDRRKAAGLSQEALAAQLGVSRQAVSKWERSESSPDTDNLIALAALYGVSLDKLLYGEAANDADVIFTDVWASMGQEQEKAQREKAFVGYQVNDDLMAVAKSDCMVQHCLPAHRGEEITAEVFEAHAGEIFDEAENRLHAQKAVLYLLMGEESR